METGTTTTRTRVTRHYWRRAESAAGWWPWGLLPALGLLVVYSYGLFRTAPHIQSEVQAEVAAQLHADGVAVADLRADGQQVTLRAESAADEERRITALATSVDCDTWAGRLRCPTGVSVALVEPTAKTPPVVTVPASITNRRAHDFEFEKTDDEVILSGEVPSDAERMRLVELAKTQFANITDRLSVSDEAATAQYPLAANRALAVLNPMLRGKADWNGGVLSASGIANADEADAARSLFNAETGKPDLGTLQIQVAEDLRRCNEDFRRALAESTVRFRSGSAAIDDGNDVLLQRLAELALACPGSVTIAGHTDSQGDDTMNQRLSLGRASAVRDALIRLGVDGKRLNATGLGESQPIADNTTAAGRATNRRIVISIDENT